MKKGFSLVHFSLLSLIFCANLLNIFNRAFSLEQINGSLDPRY